MTGLAVAALTLSLGGGHRVVGRLTFDRRVAAQGGRVYAARRPAADDLDAIRLSAALIAGSGGAGGPGARIARRHGVPAVAVRGARWAADGLYLAVPVLGEAQGTFQPVKGYEERRLAEGDAVAVDPAAGQVAAVDPSELELADALSAFDGLRDLQALLQWYDARTQSGPSPGLAARLIEEVAARLASGEATPAEFARLRRALDTGLDAGGRRTTADAAARAAQSELRASADRLDDLADDAGQAGSRAALRELEHQASTAETAARALAQEVGRPALASGVSAAAKRLRAAAARRQAALPARPLEPERALAAAGAMVPPRVELPGALYDRFVAEAGLAPRLAEISDDASLDLRRKDQRLAALFQSAMPSEGLGREISGRLPKAPLLDVCGPEGCRERVPSERALAAVRDVWAMSWSGEALGRRKRQGTPLVSPALSVSGVAPAEISGAVESRDPVTGSPRRLLVTCDTGDEYVLERGSLAEAAPPVLAVAKRCLTPEQASRAGAAARALDDALGQGIELTYAISDGRLVIRTWRANAR